MVKVNTLRDIYSRVHRAYTAMNFVRGEYFDTCFHGEKRVEAFNNTVSVCEAIYNLAKRDMDNIYKKFPKHKVHVILVTHNWHDLDKRIQEIGEWLEEVLSNNQ
jgi:hypothetical protein